MFYHLASLWDWKEGANVIYITIFSRIIGIKANMLLIIFFGLIAEMALASAVCDFGPLPLNDFDWTKLDVILKFLL
jgi:hypothetical protein